MKHIFAPDGKLFRFLNRLADLILLNALWLITSIPVFTIGASTTALYYVTLKGVKNEDTYIARSFFRSFRKNFRHATMIWTGLLLSGAILAYDYYICRQISAAAGLLLRNLLTILGLFLIMFSCYVFPVLSYFENTLRRTLINAALMSIAHLFCSVLILIVCFLPGILMHRNLVIMITGIFIYLFIGIALTGWCNSLILRKIFEHYLKN